ncbi:MAG: Wzy polymerase domain-containing protein [Polaromonas sp.]|uniref:PglL family O-oligosaccharyltransferase n=1 Tax=Polaromonas sp. TaxID=1869339 RepID=UPI0027304DE8|nr:O-antigen ligase family protein [Polaromonas sp.]MDP2451269.1 Wzy polymerase domain-containing protein [Polaromonas sp.]MDP3246398.1 Wzy polymerase domain-containing protein [Polaromonas sp.]MDP3756017.1 Wzy polymerase domain-containing protein [Polaromonas sp.]
MHLYIAAVSLLLSWLIPLHLPPWVSWHLELFAFLAVFFLAWFVFLCSSKERIRLVSFPALTLPFLGLILLAAGQFTTGLITFVGDALVFMFYMTLCVMCLTLGFTYNRQTTRPRANVRVEGNEHSGLTLLAVTLTLGAFASAIIAFAQVLDVWSSADWINRMPQLRRPGGNVAQPNHLATLLLMGMVSLLFLYEASKIKALPSALILVVLCAALAVTESRTGVLSFLLLTGWWYVQNRRTSFRLSPWLVGLSVAGFLGFFWAWPSIYDLLQQTSGLASEANTKAGSRLVVWPQLLDAVAQRPWWGWGLGDVPEAQNAVAHAYPASEPFSYSHNILLDLALGMGVPLTALLVLVTGGWLWRRVRAANQLLSWYCLAVVLPVAVHSMLEFPFAYAYFLVPVMFSLGALESAAGSKPALSIGVRPAALLLFVASVIGAWSVVEYVSIEEDFRVARFEALRVGQTPPDYRRPTVVLLTQLSALLDGARISPKPGMNPDELVLIKNVALRYPWTATQNRYALSLALNGDPEEAIRQLRVMRALHGEGPYEEIKANWNNLAQNKYPQLRELKLP